MEVVNAYKWPVPSTKEDFESAKETIDLQIKILANSAEARLLQNSSTKEQKEAYINACSDCRGSKWRYCCESCKSHSDEKPPTEKCPHFTDAERRTFSEIMEYMDFLESCKLNAKFFQLFQQMTVPDSVRISFMNAHGVQNNGIGPLNKTTKELREGVIVPIMGEGFDAKDVLQNILGQTQHKKKTEIH